MDEMFKPHFVRLFAKHVVADQHLAIVRGPRATTDPESFAPPVHSQHQPAGVRTLLLVTRAREPT